MADDIGVQIDGLLETAKAAAMMDRQAPAVAAEVVERDVEVAYREARRNLSMRAGGGSYKRMPGDLIQTGDSIKIRRGGTMVGAEFGAVQAWVFGRTTSQASLSRRQYAKYDRSGHIVGPLWKRGSGFVLKRTREVSDEFFEDGVAKQMRRAGVPR